MAPCHWIPGVPGFCLESCNQARDGERVNIVLYARVSLEETDSGDKRFQDPENQLTQLRDYADIMGHKVVAEYVDRMSGANPARPQFRKMMADALQRRFSGIIVWKIDRFSREGPLMTLSYIKQLKDRGIWLQSMTESWLNTREEGITEILFAIMSWVASEERR